MRIQRYSEGGTAARYDTFQHGYNQPCRWGDPPPQHHARRSTDAFVFDKKERSGVVAGNMGNATRSDGRSAETKPKIGPG